MNLPRILHLPAAALIAWFLQAAARAESLPTSRTNLLQLGRVWEIQLRLSAADWKAMEPAERTGTNLPGQPGGPRLLPPGGFEFPWVQGEVVFADTVFTNVGVRFKGNSSFNGSRNSHKRPFKLDFDRHVAGRRLAGLEELFLNNNVNDGSQLRESLAYAAFNRAGIPAPRTAHARVWLSLDDGSPREYLGLYTLVEPVEGDFLEEHFGSRKGLLTKPERTRGLEYLGPDWNAYTNRYEPRSKVRPADTARFIRLLREIQEARDAGFHAALTNALDPEPFLRFLAVTALLSSYDSLIGNGHNYYLFLGGTDPRFHFIPWDLNEAFGRHPGAGPAESQAGFSILRPYTAPNPFLDQVFAQPALARRYREIVSELQSGACSTNALLQDHARVSEALRPHLAGEPRRNNRQGPPQGPPGGDRPRRQPGDGNPGFRPLGPVNRGPFAEGPDLPAWISLRHAAIAAELAGTREAPRPQLQRMGPPNGRPGQPGGPFPPPGSPPAP